MNVKKFLESFPPPKYIDVPYAGVVFSDDSIRILALDKNKHPIYRSEIPLEKGIIESGKVKNESVLGKILSEKKGELSSPFVRFSIPDETSYVFTAKVPVVSGKDARESVSFILEENVPLPLSDISFDFAVQEIEELNGSRFAKVAVIAASTSLITPYVNSLRLAGFEPLLCLNESQATAFSVVPKDSREPSAIIHVHKQSAGIYIANRYFVEFSSIVPISAETSLEDSIKSEFLKAVDYWSTKLGMQSGKPNILPVFLCGEYEIVKNLEEQIKEVNNVNPLVANIWLNAFSIEDYIPDIPLEESLRFASAVGLFAND